MIGAKQFPIRFDKIYWFIKIYDGSRYLVLFSLQKYDAIYSRIRYLISQKSSITYVSFHYYVKMKVDSYDFLPLEKKLSLQKVITHIKSVLYKDQDHYYYNIFLEKCYYQLAKITVW